MKKALAIFLLLFFQDKAISKQKEIVIGLASNFSEVSSSSSNPFGGYFRDGITLAIQNAKTKLDQKEITIRTQEFDYGTSDARVLEVAKNAASSEVVAVVGYNFSSHALLAAPIHQQAGLPMITPSATANRVGSLGAFIHQACFDNAFMGETLARVALNKLKAKRAAMITAMDCAYCTDLANAFEAEFRKGGGTIVVSEQVLQKDTDFTTTFKKLKSYSFDMVLVPNQELLSARIISGLISDGISKPFLGGDGWGNVGDEFFSILGGKPLTGYSVSHWHPEEKSIKSKKFVADYKNRFGKVPNDTSVLAYDAMSILIDALLKTNDFTRSGVEKSLSKLNEFQGVTGKFIFRNKQSPRKSLVLLSANESKFNVIEKIEPSKGVAR